MIAVWSPDLLTAEGVATMLRSAPDVEVLSMDDVASVRTAVVANPTMDVDTAEQVAWINDVSSARIIVVADEIAEADLESMSSRRVAAILSHSSVTSADLIRTARDVHRVRALPAPGEQADQVRSHLVGPGFRSPPTLGLREREVLRLLVAGHGTTGIARTMAYSERTVKNIVRSALTQLSAKNRAHAVALAIRSGLI